MRAPNASSLEVDRCAFNNMVDNPRGARYEPAFVPHAASGAWHAVGPDCRQATLESIHNVHFTICQKPWECRPNRKHELCVSLHARWHALRDAFEAEWLGRPRAAPGEPAPAACAGGRYAPIDIDGALARCSDPAAAGASCPPGPAAGLRLNSMIPP